MVRTIIFPRRTRRYGAQRIMSEEKPDKQNISKLNIKIYAKPKIPEVYCPYTRWSLIKEGEIDIEGNIFFYSAQDIINEIMNLKTN